MLIVGFLVLLSVEPAFVGAVVFGATIEDPWATPAFGVLATAANLREASGLTFGGTPLVALAGEGKPILRAWEDCASRVAFSLIARCFSSSLASIGTRSSGMGLFSYTNCQKLHRQELS